MAASEKKGFWRLTVRSEFAAAHSLRYYEGKCERLHGHNFSVEVVVEGNSLVPQTEYLMDFKELKAHVRHALEKLDHQVLNEIPPFDAELNPTSENLARFLWKGLEPDLLHTPVHLYSVTVSEKAAQSATYME